MARQEVLWGPPPQRGGKQAEHDHLAELKKQRLEFEKAEVVGDRISEGRDLYRERAPEVGIGVP